MVLLQDFLTRIRSFKISQDLKKSFPDLSSDKFLWIVKDLRHEFHLNFDNLQMNFISNCP